MENYRMPRISILMSIYNETIEQIRESIDSVLRQTYSDFEFVIILDNPDYSEAIDLLSDYKKFDSRISYYVNEANIGLALSMNVAASKAEGIYYARMDADDIAEPTRLEREIAVLNTGNYDFVFCDFSFIDENGNVMEKDTYIFNDNQIPKLLPFRNIIHHPTVMFTADIFNVVGGYRNYVCAQDYDLWLRMLNANCRFHMVKEKLMKYRIRNNSTTGSKRVKQINTLRYVKKLYKNRPSMSGYNYDDYLMFLKENEQNNVSPQEKMIRKAASFFNSVRIHLILIFVR